MILILVGLWIALVAFHITLRWYLMRCEDACIRQVVQLAAVVKNLDHFKRVTQQINSQQQVLRNVLDWMHVIWHIYPFLLMAVLLLDWFI